MEKQLLNLTEYAAFLGVERHLLRMAIDKNPELYAQPRYVGSRALYWIEDIKEKIAAL